MNNLDHEKKQTIDKSYISPDDKFLFAFDEGHAKSASQLKEIKKHQRIATLRDNVVDGSGEQEVWSGF